MLAPIVTNLLNITMQEAKIKGTIDDASGSVIKQQPNISESENKQMSLQSDNEEEISSNEGTWSTLVKKLKELHKNPEANKEGISKIEKEIEKLQERLIILEKEKAEIEKAINSPIDNSYKKLS